MMKREILGKHWSRLAANRNGAAAAEFALLLPVLSLMLLGTIQYGALLYSYNTMLTAARDGTRALAVDSSTEIEVVYSVKGSLPAWVPKDKWTITPQNAATTGTGLVNTYISVPSQYATPLALGPMPDVIDVRVVMQSES